LADSVPAVPFIRGQKKKFKMKEINGSLVSKRAPSENGQQQGEIQQPKRAQ
jgi:hypothetical protein